MYVLLEDNCRGVLHFQDLPNYKTDIAYIFHVGQLVYVRKEQMIFNDMVAVNMNGLLEKEFLEELSGEELYGIVYKKLQQGTMIQVTSTLQVCIYGVYLQLRTKIIVFLRQTKNGKIKVYLSSVLYYDDVTEPIFSLQYKKIEFFEENQSAA